jgi:hypothetical protein
LGHGVPIAQSAQWHAGVGMAAWGALGHLGTFAIEKKSMSRFIVRRCSSPLYAYTV